MSKKTFFAVALVVLVFAGCKKDTDNASKWVGTYTATSGGGIVNSYVNQVIVEESNNFTLRLFLNNSASNTTYVVLQNVTLQNATSGTIGESDTTLGVHGVVQYTGSVSLIGGDTLKMLCAFVDSAGGPSTSFNFYGAK